MRPPAWYTPLMAPINWVAVLAVSRLKYDRKLGCPSVVAIIQVQYPYVKLPSVENKMTWNQISIKSNYAIEEATKIVVAYENIEKTHVF
jgi:hypothetical protein